MTPEILGRTVLLGMGATLVLDVFSLLRKHLQGIPALNYAMVGRWLVGLAAGRLALTPHSPPARGETALGWIAHYAIGVALAATLPLFWGPAWLAEPTVPPALAVGVLSVSAPWLILQPALGAGLAARHAARPWLARGRSLLAHAVFGMGLYLTAWLMAR
ncbi:DUF2938 family protein [Bordetella trematum]|uniref:DUF2938 family protein n=1 Tax=Bordetella trematum TaxID=123899 RepID=UPI00398A4950